MKNRKFNEIVNPKFFENEPNFFVCNHYSRKFPLMKNKFVLTDPCLIICNKMTKYDKYLVSKTIVTDFVFLKGEIVQKINDGELSKKDTLELLAAIKSLKENNIPIALFPEKQISIFGKTQDFSINLTNFLFDTNLDIKLMNFVGSYYSYPVWSDLQRRCDTTFHQQKNITHESLIGYLPEEINKIINDSKLSSASTYAQKYPVFINSNNLANGIERIIYACPSCGELFSLYSEYNCLKCKSCLAAIEFSTDGQILFSEKIKNFDDIDDFLTESLTTRDFNYNLLKSYDNISICERQENGNIKPISKCKLNIFADKFEIDEGEKIEKFTFSTVDEILFDYKNTVSITYSKNKNLILRGNNNENLYILKTLDKLNLK